MDVDSIVNSTMENVKAYAEARKNLEELKDTLQKDIKVLQDTLAEVKKTLGETDTSEDTPSVTEESKVEDDNAVEQASAVKETAPVEKPAVETVDSTVDATIEKAESKPASKRGRGKRDDNAEIEKNNETEAVESDVAADDEPTVDTVEEETKTPQRRGRGPQKENVDTTPKQDDDNGAFLFGDDELDLMDSVDDASLDFDGDDSEYDDPPF